MPAIEAPPVGDADVPQADDENKKASAPPSALIASYSKLLYQVAMRRIAYTRVALKQLQALPEPAAIRIRSKIEQYAKNPPSLADNVRRLQGREGYRLRVGDYRVIFDDDGNVLDILSIGLRGSVYR